MLESEGKWCGVEAHPVDASELRQENHSWDGYWKPVVIFSR